MPGKDQHLCAIVVYLVDEPVASDPNAPLIFSPAEPTASWRTRVLAGVSNGYVYAALNIRRQPGHLLLYLAGISTAKAMLVAGDLALSNLLHGLFAGDDLFLAPLDGRLGFPDGL